MTVAKAVAPAVAARPLRRALPPPPRTPVSTALVLYLVFVAVHLVLGLAMRNPVVQSDEGGYLGTAHYIAHGSGLPNVTSQYHPAYALLLAPFSWMFGNPLTVYRASLVLNAFLLGTLSVSAYALARYVLPPGMQHARVVVGVLVALYPPFLVFSNLAMAESLFIPAFLLTCLAVVRAVRLGGVVAWFACGALAGFLYAIDPVGLVVVIAVLLVALRALRATVPRLRSYIGLLLGLQAALAPATALIHEIDDATTAGRLGTALPATATADTTNRIAVNAGSVLDHFQGRLGDLLSEMAGQAFYLTVSTYGLFVVGMVVAGISMVRVARGSRTVGDRLASFVGLCMVGTWLLSSVLIVSSGQPPRPDSLVHGRYNEAVLAPVLVLGVAGLAGLTARRAARWQAWALVVWAATAVTGLGLRLGHSAEALRGEVVGVNVFGIAPVVTWLGRVDPLVLGVGAALVATAAALLAKRGGLQPVAILLAVVFAAMGLSGVGHLWADSRGRSHERVVAETLGLVESRFAEAPDCIGYDVTAPSDWHFFNYQLFLPHLDFRAFRSDDGGTPCSELVITGHLDLDERLGGARVVAYENHAQQSLWVLPGPLQDELAKLGWLVPADFPNFLPDAAYVSEIRLARVRGEGRPIVTLRGRRTLEVRLTHAGGDAPWPNVYGAKRAKGVVRLAAIWLAADAPTVPLGESRVELPRSLLPGQSTVVDLRLDPVSYDGEPLPAGRYLVWVTPVQEDYVHFFERGDVPYEIEVELKR